jgi:HTH-type transcriptional regulator/antitoxin HigA
MDAMLIVVENDAERERAAGLVSRLMGSADPRDRARLRAQAQLIQAYEKARWPVQAPDTTTVISYLVDQHGLTRADMAMLLGTESRVSEVLSGKRGLSISMIRRLRERFGVSADVLIPEGGGERSARGRIAEETEFRSS